MVALGLIVEKAISGDIVVAVIGKIAFRGAGSFINNLLVRPSFFNFLIYDKIFKILESGSRNKNKNKIPKIVQLIKR